MFVKNIVDTAADSVTANVKHDGTNLFTGNIKSVPFYYLNQKVESISISGTNLVIEI